jgi:DNA-binding transcriptional LysR family regulator
MEAQLQGLSNIITGSVRVGTVHSVGLYELSEPLKAYFSDFPQVNVYLEYDRASSVYDQVLRGNVDFGIVAYPTARAQITVIEFRSDRLLIACAPGHPLTERGRVPVGALDGEKFIGFEKGIPTRMALDRLFRSKNINVQYVAELDNIEMIKRLVEVGAGVALLPEKSFAFEVQTGSLVKIEMADKELRRPIGIIYRTGKHFGAPAEKLMEYLRGQDTVMKRRGAKAEKQKLSAP